MKFFLAAVLFFSVLGLNSSGPPLVAKRKSRYRLLSAQLF